MQMHRVACDRSHSAHTVLCWKAAGQLCVTWAAQGSALMQYGKYSIEPVDDHEARPLLATEDFRPCTRGSLSLAACFKCKSSSAAGRPAMLMLCPSVHRLLISIP